MQTTNVPNAPRREADTVSYLRLNIRGKENWENVGLKVTHLQQQQHQQQQLQPLPSFTALTFPSPISLSLLFEVFICSLSFPLSPPSFFLSINYSTFLSLSFSYFFFPLSFLLSISLPPTQSQHLRRNPEGRKFLSRKNFQIF